MQTLRPLLIAIFCYFIVIPLTAQINHLTAEYFFDVDPGFGNGIALAVTAANMIDENYEVDISVLAPGVHHLYIRTKDEFDNWSQTSITQFYKPFGVGSPPPPSPNHIIAEYFFDIDSGFGNGTALAVTAADIIDENYEVDISALASGVHHLYIRTKDEFGNWSQTSITKFYKPFGVGSPPASPPNHITAEYFFDIDPGFGNGTALAVTAADMIDENYEVDISALALGLHHLYLRTKDEFDNWSQTNITQFYKPFEASSPPSLPNHIAAEYFFDADPGFGNGTALAVTAADIIDENYNIDISHLSEGFHDLYMRTQDENGNWSMVYVTNFEKQLMPTNNCTDNSIVFVDKDAVGTMIGDSWGNAFTHLQEAIDFSCPCNNVQIWVAEGTYMPTRDTSGNGTPVDNRDKTFYIDCDVEIYGGFIGSEMMLSERDYENNITILSGDFKEDDIPITDIDDANFPAQNNEENAYTVVHTFQVSNNFIMDGFQVLGGNADFSSATSFSPERSGSAWYNEALGNNSSSPTINNCSFLHNYASFAGAMFHINSEGINSPALTNCYFSNNATSGKGGALYNRFSNTKLTDCTFFNNTASSGGAMYNTQSNPEIINCTYLDNVATSTGGGIFNTQADVKVRNSFFAHNSAGVHGGALYNSFANPEVINCVFSNNSGSIGGAMSNSSSDFKVINSTFSNNAASSLGGGMYNVTGNSEIVNTIFWNNTKENQNNVEGADIENTAFNSVGLTVTYTLTQINSTYSSGVGILNNQDPLFTDADGADNILGTLDDDLTLQTSSPAIDVGDKMAIEQTGTLLDLDGNPRIDNCEVDMGAYENQATGNSDCEAICSVEMLSIDGNPDNNNIIDSDVYWAVTSITSIGTVSSTNDVTFKAGESITLLPGFYVQSGGVFAAIIEACEPPIQAKIEWIEGTPALNASTLDPLQAIEWIIYPNPFYQQTTLELNLPKADRVSLTVYNQMGKEVLSLLDQRELAAGNHHFLLKDDQLQNGWYYISMKTSKERLLKKVIALQH